jgi:GDP/UDP-N,N'-diacetylbacillosamine 2-epimerase (hydrolysing)
MGGYCMMKVVVLTSSRADFGIYLPLLRKLEKDPFFQLEIVAFGTHLSKEHGYTIDDIKRLGFKVKDKIETVPQDDSAYDIALSMGITTQKFADFWKKKKNNIDLALCLGDRYEMFAAVSAGIPFNIPFAHLHGGETTLGAIDNVFRHSISLASKLHFVATDSNEKRLIEILGTKNGIHCVGALSLDNLIDFEVLSLKEFEQNFEIDLSKKTILCTVHPETAGLVNNHQNIVELILAIEALDDYQFLITLPNADTYSMEIRMAMIIHLQFNKQVKLVENLGTKGYFSAMQHCAMLLGNTSSGIIEAASFGKYVVNLGDRQKGREAGQNVFQVPFNCDEITAKVREIEKSPNWTKGNLYDQGGAADRIIDVLKEI